MGTGLAAIFQGHAAQAQSGVQAIFVTTGIFAPLKGIGDLDETAIRDAVLHVSLLHKHAVAMGKSALVMGGSTTSPSALAIIAVTP